MEVHKIEIIVEDFDGLGAEEIKHVIENARYPNRCILPKVRSIVTRDCGEWQDNHPLNHRDKREAALRQLFAE